MRAIVVRQFGDPEVLRQEELPDPTPGPREVLVRIEAAGVNPVDTYVRSGAYERLPELPYIPGGDGAGIVVATGEGIEHLREGDRVYVAGAAGGSLTGCSATLAAKPITQVYPLPDEISFAQGAAVGVPYATAYRALFHKAEMKAGDTLLIHGASGGVGIAAVQLAAAAGVRVVGTASSEEGRELVRAHGAERALDHRAPGYLDELGEWTDGRGVDGILEMAAHVNLGNDLQVAARGGRVVIVGCRGPVQIQPREALVKDLTIRGFSLSNAGEAEMASIHGALVEGMAAGRLQPVVARVFPFAEAPAAHRVVAEGRGGPGKIVLAP